MQPLFTAQTTYFLEEGKANLLECLKIAFLAARQHNVKKIVIFTAVGEGVRLALEKFCSTEEFRDIGLVAVTFPQGKQFSDSSGPIRVEFPSENEELCREHGVPIVRAHLPFDPIAPVFSDRGPLAQDLSLVGDALKMFCGSMALCVQAIVLACDAGAVEIGEHVIAMTSDTAILAQATSTRRMLRELVIREVLCKPVILTIGKKEKAEALTESSEQQSIPESAQEPQALPDRQSEKKSD